MANSDVVIVGAGPAGAILGYELAKLGIDAVILEKRKLPRYKACAGGITVRAANLLDFDIAPVTEQLIYRVKISYKLGNGYFRGYDKPLIYMTMRDRFDHFLIERAKEAGAQVIDGQKVEQIEPKDDHVEILTAAHKFKGRIVVGADGANSIVARTAGLTQNVQFGIGMQAEVCVPSEVLARWHSTIGMDLGYMSGGYGWVFPKKDHLSIGVGTWGANTISVKSLKPYFERLLRSLSLGDYSIASLKGHLMPLRRRGAAIQRNNILLLGDAAGLIHTYTGEGIYYAIRSAQLAAPLIAKSLETNAMELYNYEKAVDEELMPSLQAARGLAALLHYPHYLCFVGAKRSERVWRAACRLVRGERSEVKQELGLLRFPVKLLGAMSQRRK